MRFIAVHIVNELSIKNISISQIIISFLKHYNKNKIKSKLLTQNIDKYFFKKIRKNYILNILSIFSLIYKKKKLIIHLHGIWGLNQLIFIFLSKLIKLNLIIHSHGMMNVDAINSNQKIKFLKKKIYLNLMKIFLIKNAIFLTSTRQESQQIKKYFPIYKNKIIHNLIETKKSETKVRLKKNFVYFGRINSHKNIADIIKAFTDAKLKNWNLNIYGIDDDQKYLRKIKNLVKYKENVKILKPIFGEKKYKLLKSSWVNILFSNSEIISFSLIESSFAKTPTIISNRIYLNKMKYPKTLITKHNIKSLKNTILSISKLTINEREILSDKILQTFEKEFSLKKILTQYNNLYYANFGN